MPNPEESPITLIVGLGNPGPKYELTRHNIGFMALEHFAETIAREASYSLSEWSEKFSGLYCEARLGETKVGLLKPLTYMNKSGEAVGALLRFYKKSSQELIVLHDEVDLPSGDCRLKKGGGEGGHNGLRSISAALGTNDYWRIRLGVGKPEFSPELPAEARHAKVSDWVLGKLCDQERTDFSKCFTAIDEALKEAVLRGPKIAQSLFNRKGT